MTQLRERSTFTTRQLPDEAVLERPDGHAATILRTLGAIAVLVVGAVHLEQYFSAAFDTVSVIGTLFVLNFAGATVIGLGLLVPAARLRVVHLLLALGGIALSATSFVFLFVSEHQPLFGFQESGYRTAIVVALAAEAAAVVTLGRTSSCGFGTGDGRSRTADQGRGLAVIVVVGEQHARDVPEHEEHHENGDDIHEHRLVLPPASSADAGRSDGIGETISRRRRRRRG